MTLDTYQNMRQSYDLAQDRQDWLAWLQGIFGEQLFWEFLKVKVLIDQGKTFEEAEQIKEQEKRQ